MEANQEGEEVTGTRTGQSEEQKLLQRVWSWGAGTDGQLSTGKLEDENLPQLLLHFPNLSSAGTVSMLACGGAHVIALTSGTSAASPLTRVIEI